MRRVILLFPLLLLGADGTYSWNLPKGFPRPLVPADNPMTVEKVELGRYLFYDVRLSSNGNASCATCHKQALAFTDGRSVAVGVTGESHPRGAMSLVNVAYSGALTWGNPSIKLLEQQALVPMYGEHPIELGMREGDSVLPALRSDPKYLVLFKRAFPERAGERITTETVTKAIACFERSIVSARSPYDRYHYGGDETAVSDSARRCSSASRFPVSLAMADSTSAEILFRNGDRAKCNQARWNSTIQVSTISLARCPIQVQTPVSTNSRKYVEM